MSNSFFPLIFRQKYIRRWGLMRSTVPESLSEHSFETAVIAHALALIGNRMMGKSYDEGKVLAAALYHDASEVITGDLPTPVKYYDETIRSSYKNIEDNALSLLLSKLPEELRGDYSAILYAEEKDADIRRLVKAADKLCAYIKCVEEEKCGNSEFSDARISTYKKLKECGCEEAAWFIANVLPAFENTLDRL